MLKYKDGSPMRKVTLGKEASGLLDEALLDIKWEQVEVKSQTRKLKVIWKPIFAEELITYRFLQKQLRNYEKTRNLIKKLIEIAKNK